MFTFNFKSGDKNETSEETRKIDEAPSEEVSEISELSSIIDWTTFSTTTKVDDIEILLVDSSKIVNHLKLTGGNQLSVLKADNEHSDLIPGVYEGGMKVWESTYDLGEFLRKTSPTIFENKNVLDLGCGSGILGILALKMGASSVHFQDYNNEVLSCVTIPNVKLNSGSIERCKFWSGDWGSFEKIDNTRFDVILSSETIYNPANQEKLHSVIQSKLKPGGEAYIAGKSYYFGVGGSMQGFRMHAQNKGVFKVTNLWSADGGTVIIIHI